MVTVARLVVVAVGSTNVQRPLVERQEEGITFGEITIPAVADPQPLKESYYVMKAVAGRKGDERDRVEKEFLKWRENNMKVRLERTRKRLRDD